MKKKLFILVCLVVLLNLGLYGCSSKGTALYFVVNDSLYETLYLKEPGVITLPAEPTQPGYEFKGWYTDGNLITADSFKNTLPTHSVMIYARLDECTYQLSFDLDGGTLPEETYTYQYALLNQALPVPSKPGYRFLGWSRSDRNPDVLYTDIPAKTYGDLTYVAHWELGTFTVSFDTRGGNSLASLTVEAFSTITLPLPQKTQCSFKGWYTSLDFSEACGENLMVQTDVILYAAWDSDYNYKLNYTDNVPLDDAIHGNKASGETVCLNEYVFLETPYYLDSYVFKGWYQESTCISACASFGFAMTENMTLTAQYEAVTTVVDIDLANQQDVTITLTNSIQDTTLMGSDFTAIDYSITDNVLTLKYTALSRQDLGYLSLYLEPNWIILHLYSSTNEAHQIDIDYDAHYPDVTLNFEGTGTYEVSLNGSTYVKATSGMILNNYDKSRVNTITLRECHSLVETTVSKEGYTSQSQSYYNSTFTFNGQTYDYVFDSLEELEIFIQYVALVDAPLNAVPSVTYPYGSYESRGWCSSHILAENSESVFIDLFNDFSTSCAISFSYRGATFNAPVANIGINFLSTLNDQTSDYTVKDLTDKQGLLTAYNETNRENNLPIDSFTQTQEIKTLYELENLSAYIKPIIKDNVSFVSRVYTMARRICATYIQSNMSDYEKVTVFYNYLALNVTYDNEVAQYDTVTAGAYTAFTSYGALINHKAVCDGIASAFKVLCLIEGIECIEVVGSYNDSGHAWNKVKIDQAWWGVDATWARVDTYVNHAYLFMSEEALVATGHVEHSYGVSIKTTIANGLTNYYQMTSMGAYNCSLWIDNTEELKMALAYANKNNISVLEIATHSNNFKSNLNWAVISTGINVIGTSKVTVTGLNYIVYYIVLK